MYCKHVEYAEDDQQPICWREVDEISCISTEIATPILRRGLSTAEGLDHI